MISARAFLDLRDHRVAKAASGTGDHSDRGVQHARDGDGGAGDRDPGTGWPRFPPDSESS
jgi:hypothetical protein